MAKGIEFKPECFGKGIFDGGLELTKPSVDDLFDGSAIAKKITEVDFSAAKELIVWSKKFYVKVDVKSVDGTVYSSFDDLFSDGETLEILKEVAEALVTGINKKKLMIQQNHKTAKSSGK